MTNATLHGLKKVLDDEERQGISYSHIVHEVHRQLSNVTLEAPYCKQRIALVEITQMVFNRAAIGRTKGDFYVFHNTTPEMKSGFQEKLQANFPEAKITYIEDDFRGDNVLVDWS